MIEIKKVLNDLVDYTYKDSENLEQYKKFFVEVINKNMKSKHGDYNPRTHHIRIFNLYRADAVITATTIHELAHHVDAVNRGNTDHSKEFYNVFQQLLFTGLNMKLFTIEDFLAANRDASDSNKIAKMLEGYEAEYVAYKKDMQKICVSNCYSVKDVLKQHGYRYNLVSKDWYKEVSLSEMQTETDFLSKLQVEFRVSDANTVSFEKKMYIVAMKGAYDRREELKEAGFYYSRNEKVWKKDTTKEMYGSELILMKTKFPDVEFCVN